jgi:uncharacterized protein YqjF (DUF2071 family)
MRQTWNDLLFAHWPLAPEAIRTLVPGMLQLDLHDGRAWVAVTPFHMSGIRGRALPYFPGLSVFPELNVRTYVTFKGVPGVYFFSLDAARRVAVWGARATFFLPYFFADMSAKINGDEVHYHSRRVASQRIASSAEFRGRYSPLSGPRQSQPGGLEHFLTERYCLYAVRRREVFRAGIHHLPWPLQDAEAEIQQNTMAEAAGIALPTSGPLLHFSKKLDVLVWWPEKVG